ncbi:aminoglycoside phosphotransferase family protein [Chungangia koreensis]|uniref:Aminoglycoside phosphotransferase family protein n=1 Tax=Chungangia koreensis TaxID=752657 RepID=A0ABV8XA62_9LACT
MFTQKIIGAFGKEGEEFLKGLEEKIKKISEHWDLTIEGHVENLSYNYVAKAIDQNSMPVILKIGVANFDFKNEAITVRAYNGKGCAKLLREDVQAGAMLLERLQPGMMLFELSEKEAVEHFAEVWKSIRRPFPPDWPFPTILDWSKGLDRYLDYVKSSEERIPVKMVKRAKAIFDDLMKTSENLELLHGDLHHENILYSDEKGWSAIDPKGVVGDPYFDLTSFLTNHLFEKANPKSVFEFRINRLISLLNLDRDRFLRASFAMAMLYACWGMEDQDNEGALNTFTCAEWLDEFILSSTCK